MVSQLIKRRAGSRRCANV